MKWYKLCPFVLQKLIWIPTRLILLIFAKLDVRGLENLRDIRSNVIFASNHASEIDPFLVPASLPFFSRFSPLFYAVREKSFYDGNGWRKHLFNTMFINAWGGYGVVTGLHDYEKALGVHLQIAKDSGSFCIFPEGGITRDGKLQQGRGGLAYLAERSGMVIIPVGFSGTYSTTALDFFLRRRHIKVSFGRPITQEELRSKVSSVAGLGIRLYKEESAYIMLKIEELISK